MILIDSSIWIDHFRRANGRLVGAALQGLLVQHPYVTAELALGSIPNREATLTDMRSLPQMAIVGHEELLRFVSAHELNGTGLGYVDASLLASAHLSEGVKLWTRDKRLATQASRLGLRDND